MGKERLAQFIHERSERRGPLVAVNCAVLPKELLASELFGHIKGAFSGATSAREGLFTRSAGGTLFLDEVGELPLEQQAALLRVLQEGKVRPVGADHEHAVDCRVVCATNRDLSAAVDAGEFRQDLYARLAHLVFRMPSLRERREEILELFNGFAAELGGNLPLDADSAESLISWDWPNNVRSLQSVVNSLFTYAPNKQVTLAELRASNENLAASFRRLSRAGAQPRDSDSENEVQSPLDRQNLKEQLARCGGNVVLLAKELGVHRSRLYRLLQRSGLSPEDFR